MFAAAVRPIAAKGIDSPETTVWLESARGMAALAGEDVPGSRDHFGRAWQAARPQPELFSPRQIVNFGQRHAFALIPLADGPAAEKRSAERRVGKACVSKRRSRGCAAREKKKVLTSKSEQTV